MDGNDERLLGRQVKLPSVTIGQLARRTGLSVKTIRWYSDQGLVPPAGLTASGYRLFGVEALAHQSSGPAASWRTWRPGQTGARSVTGNSWESSTDGRRSRRSFPPSSV